MARGVDANQTGQAAAIAFGGQSSSVPRYGIIGKLITANLNTTADQAFVMNTGFTTYQIDRILATNKSATPTLAAGGIYTAAAKGGSPIVAATQVFTTLSATNIVTALTLALTTSFTANPLYLSLTTANGSAATCDMYIWGWMLN